MNKITAEFTNEREILEFQSWLEDRELYRKREQEELYMRRTFHVKLDMEMRKKHGQLTEEVRDLRIEKQSLLNKLREIQSKWYYKLFSMFSKH